MTPRLSSEAAPPSSAPDATVENRQQNLTLKRLNTFGDVKHGLRQSKLAMSPLACDGVRPLLIKCAPSETAHDHSTAGCCN
jgi:hypothetical protein